MTLPLERSGEFLRFLLQAKRHTYASQGDEATVSPLLAGSKQLEWQEGDWLYRDIYFGMAYFVGQETVSYQQIPLWSMSYAGGVSASITSTVQISQIYRFLRGAMQQVSPRHPLRGPQFWQDEDYAYTDHYHGEIDAFWGHETIHFQQKMVYELHYSGGFLR